MSSLPEMLSQLGELNWEKVERWLLGDGLRILLTLALAIIVRWLLLRMVGRIVGLMTSKSAQRVAEAGRGGRFLAEAAGLAHTRHRQRLTTLGSLLSSIITTVVFGIATLTIMALVGLPLGPLLASAGVGGVALGFGAQSLVKDFLSGVFMILEDQYGVGDVIDTGEAVGTVEEVSLRVTRLRDANGVTWYIRNGEIVRIGNRSQGWSTATVDIPVSYEENVEHVLAVIRAAADQLSSAPAWQERLLETPNVVGVESIQGATMTVRIIAKCTAGENYAVQRELRERVKAALDAAGVKAPPVTYGGPR